MRVELRPKLINTVPGGLVLTETTTLALNNQIKIYADLFCDVGVRYPAAFAVTAAVT